MLARLQRFCQGGPFFFDGNAVTVNFENGRHHRVCIEETDETIELHALVAKAAAVKTLADLPLRIWRHNRASQLVGFRLDRRGSVWARAWVGKRGLTREEFLVVLRRVATESDRFEFLLTGKDAE